MRRLPKPDSMVVVIETTLPSASTIEKWLVPGRSSRSSGLRGSVWRQGGLPGMASGAACSGLIRWARAVR